VKSQSTLTSNAETTDMGFANAGAFYFVGLPTTRQSESVCRS
jgi:hypothetical protein